MDCGDPLVKRAVAAPFRGCDNFGADDMCLVNTAKNSPSDRWGGYLFDEDDFVSFAPNVTS
ncbi:hypothetical protein SERLA73DRAFT_174041 [Serpula lacrymans var. lacrymans S7.3]|uniref:Uncharacterized protein n=1 Tax=Serpula lacrymans var. lacrymans (strain S7.3) TaxID=936435 RepID=F8PHD0_SERL3|nr:hypothetical protein SERLA73DRAFT_174041 [Serpula lacrymans var. lacrymans S7.3]